MTLNRRDAILLPLGQADRVAVERERQSAIDAARGYSEAEPTVASAVVASRPSLVTAALARLRSLRLRLFGPRVTRER